MSNADRRSSARGGSSPSRYVPPGLDASAEDSRKHNMETDDYANQPPKSQRLTGKISTLFRREVSGSASRRVPQVPVSVPPTTIPPTAAVVAAKSNNAPEEVDPRLGALSGSSRASTRVFYSSNGDDDSEDSYVSRASRHSAQLNDSARSASVCSTSTYTSLPDDVKTILRYRGFSTSIESLFLDESLVCASMGCFGLVLSNRTEYLLQLRNERRGTTSPRNKSDEFPRTHLSKTPSRAIAWGLVVTVLAMFATSVVLGFGAGHSLAAEYAKGYDYININKGVYATDDAVVTDDEFADGNNATIEWDDYLAQNDGYYNNRNQNYNNRNYYTNDDGNPNEENGGNDGYNYYGGDDTAISGDDSYGNRARRVQVEVNAVPRSQNGIFKLRDAQNFWNPVVKFVKAEWNRPDEALVPSRVRRNEESESSIENNEEYEETKRGRDLASDIRIGLFISFLLFLGTLGRRRRIRTRFYLTRARAQEDHLLYASSKADAAHKVAFEDTREDQYEVGCTHGLCGCYPADEIVTDVQDDEEVEVTDTGIFRRKKKPHHQDVVSRAFSCLMSICCGFACQCWCQALSVCALAQEAREIRLLVPSRYQRVDFITHQPFHEYQKAVQDLRIGYMAAARTKSANPMLHWVALSTLSRYIMLSFVVATTFIVGTLLLNPRVAFSWEDIVLLAATFLQSFLVLLVVHWIFHKSDLSLDAVIKLFAAGFCVAVPAAFVFEGLLVNCILLGVWSVYEMFALVFGADFEDCVFEYRLFFWIFGEFCNAYMVAAVLEELCKYYAFRAVEHPDLIFLNGLDRSEQDGTITNGGAVAYPFAAHKVQELNREGLFEEFHASPSREKQQNQRSNLGDLIHPEAEFENAHKDFRTHRQKAMAITIGMISVAIGLACAENFIYVFVLGGGPGSGNADEATGDIFQEWIVLFFRSIFPIHALGAALQSINMIRKFVEGEKDDGHRIGVGRIVLPAIILHGSFDAILMGINVFIETAWDNYLDEKEGNAGGGDPYNKFVVNLVAWIGISGVMLLGVLWYFVNYRSQRLRLIELEEKMKARLKEPNWVPATANTEIV